MPYTNTMLTLDREILNDIKRVDPAFNLSEKVRDFLQRYKDFMMSNTLGYDMEILLKKRNKAEKELGQATAELEQLNTQILAVEKQREEETEKRLKHDRAEATKKITCIVCGIPKSDEKLKKFPKGMVCHACFMTADKRTLKNFMGENGK